MKNSIKYFIAVLAIALTITSCSNDDDSPVINELDGLSQIMQIENSSHVIELYSAKGVLQQGYNDINLRIKNKQSSEYIENATISWKPLMHMTMMTHACPFSAVTKKTEAQTLYNGYIVFQMAQNDTEYWDLEIKYTINGTDFVATSKINVPPSSKRGVLSFNGTDSTKYVVALIEPTNPKVAVNDLKVGVWKMESMTDFPLVDGYTVKIDPRMPSMANHSSPNNVNAIQTVAGGWYNGKVAFTMTGYWKINLQIADKEGAILKGETISETTESSSIFFEIEF